MALVNCKECKKEISSSAKKCPECGKDQRNWFMRHKVLTVILVLFGLGIISSALGNNNEVKPTVNQNTNQVEQQSKQQEEIKWVEVKKWSGTGIKKTEPFEITSKQWRINWKNTNGQYGGVLQIMVQKPGSDLPLEIAANTTETASDTSYVYKTGTFILNINSANSNWEVTVEQQQ